MSLQTRITALVQAIGADIKALYSGKVGTSDARLTDAREWTASTVSQAEAEAGTATTRRAWTAQRVFQAIAAWWAASAMKTKLDGIATGATANTNTDSLAEGATNLYHTAARVRSVVLTGLSLATNAAIAATDTVLSSLGKLQAQITALGTTVSNKVDKVAGKQLSTEDYTTAEKDKLASLSPTGTWVQLTQAEYDALVTKDPNTLYIVVG